MNYTEVKSNYKLLSFKRDIQELLWDIVFDINILENWIGQDFYHFKEADFYYGGKFGRFDSFSEYLSYGNFPSDVRKFLRWLRDEIGRLIITKRQRRILWWLYQKSGKYIIDKNNLIGMENWDKDKLFLFSCWFNYFKLEKRNFGEDTWEKNGETLFSGFIFTKKQLKKLLKVKIEN